MSDELRYRSRKFSLGSPRRLTPEEIKFLTTILRHGEGGNEFLNRLEDCVVQEMKDGMGSLYFQSARNTERKLGRPIVEVDFCDRDGVPVSVVVNLDNHGELFELDIWKVDFSHLREFPNPEDIVLKRLQRK